MGKYQRGSLRRVKGRNGDSWEWRYRVKGVMKQETYSFAEFPTEASLWKHLEPSISRINQGDLQPVQAAPTMRELAKKYKNEYLPKLSKSTRDTDTSMIDVHIVPRWGDVKLPNIRPSDVETWTESLKLSSSSRGRARRTMKQMWDRAMFWGLVPIGQNPMSLVKVRGSSKREKPIVLLAPEEANRLMQKLPSPVNLMVLTASSLGLRVSEVLALKWTDFDFRKRIVTISRSFSHGALKEVKTPASASTLPVSSNLLGALKAHNATSNSHWVFPSPRTGRPMSADTLLSKIIKPIAKKLGMPNIGWHTLRHSYKSWIGGTNATLTQQKDLMRHSVAAMTMNYGGTPVDEMRPLNTAVASKLTMGKISVRRRRVTRK